MSSCDSQAFPVRVTEGLLRACLLVILIPAVTSAQYRAGQIRARVTEGEKVAIINEDGSRVTGRVVELKERDLTVSKGKKRLTVAVDGIMKIDRQKDSLLNGAVFGLAVGAAWGWRAFSEYKQSYEGGGPFCAGIFDDCTRDSPVGYVLVWGGLGTLVGASVDALLYGRNRTLYRRSDALRMTLTPTLHSGARGASLSLSW